MAMSLREQCSLRAFGFGGENPYNFASPLAKWPLLPVSFMTYRWIFALYQLTIYVLNLVFWPGSPGNPPSNDAVKAKYLIYVSNWSYTLLTLYAIWSAFSTLYWHVKGKKGANVKSVNGNDIAMENSTATEADMIDSASVHLTPRTPWYFKVNWALQVAACAAEFGVTSLFWVLEYNPAETDVDFFTLNVHGLGLVLVVIDFLLVANPCRILHFVYPMLYVAIYFLFTFVYHEAGGRNPDGDSHIYRGSLDWGTSTPKSLAVSLVVTFVAAPLIHLFYFLLHLLKISFGKCCRCCKPY